MGTIVVTRLPRRPAAEYPSGELVLEPPPEVVPADGARWQQLLMMLPMLAGTVAMALMYSSFSGRGDNTIMYITGGLFGLSAVGMLGSQFLFSGGQTKRQALAARRQYVRYLAQQRIRVRRTVEAQCAILHDRYPDPATLETVPAGRRLWERRPTDPDFGMIRIGIGPQELATPLVPPQTKPVDQLDPLCAAALRRFIHTYAVVDDLPVVMALDGFARIHLRGDPARCRALARAIVVQAVTFHAPEDLLVAVCAGAGRWSQWEWTKWLPHAAHPRRTDAIGPIRLMSESITGLDAMLDDVVANRPRFDPAERRAARTGPHVLLILDGGSVAGSDHLMAGGGIEGVTIVDLSSEVPRLLDYSMLVLEVTADGALTSATLGAQSAMGRTDAVSVAEAELLARRLAPLRLSAATRGELAISSDINLADVLQLDDPYQLDPRAAWQARPNRDRLRVPVGISIEGAPVELDLKESAQDGMGPHGLVVGATGSGKSEFLRTLILALAATHDSETLNFVLVDFKGGATFTRLDRLPHTSAVITNLADELHLVDRMTDAINGELVRRQELLRAAGNYVSQRDYERARAAGAPLAPLASLLIVCDEFSELLTARPDFIDMFLQIGRVGRSLGVHLLLASQRLEEGRLRGLDTHLSYRIGFRTFSAMESRAVLGVADAYELPRSPGHGFMKVGTEPMIRFRAAYASGTYRRGSRHGAAAERVDDRVLEFTAQYAAPSMPAARSVAVAEADDDGGESLLDIIVDRIEGRGTPAHQVWLAPLAEPPPLGALLPTLRVDPERGLTVADARLHGRLVAAAGLVDRPFEQRRDVLWLDLSGGGGHAVVVGGPQTGKSTVLRAVVASLALTHTPREVQFYCLDFGGGALGPLRGLPHVGGVAGRLDGGQVRRTVAEVTVLLAERERRFTEAGIDSVATYRRLRRDGGSADPFGDVFLVVDGWATIRSDFEDLEPMLADIAGRGLTYGVHLLASASRWMELRPAVRDLIATRLELRLGEPSDSVLNRSAATSVPEQSPGRGLTMDRHHFIAALARKDGRTTVEDLADGVADLVSDVAAAWSGPGAPPVRLLPPVLPYADLPITDSRPGVPIGIAELDLGPVFLDLADDAHFLLYGDSGSGKSAFLRAFAQAIVDRNTPGQARMVLIDYRRSLLRAVRGDHLIGYGTSNQRATAMLAEVAQVMRTRLPGPDVAAEQLRDRSWWRGPRLYVLVDDYELVASAAANPLEQLQEFLGHGRDIGLHVVLARRSGGANRAMYEPVTLSIRELGSSGIVLSGDRDEGPLLGSIKPTTLPPGRGWLVSRRAGAQLIQLAWLEPPA